MQDSIEQNAPKIKSRVIARGFREEVFFVLVILLVSFASFGLGRLSVVSGTEKEEVKIQRAQNNSKAEASVSLAKINVNNTSGGEVVASKNGTKYYLPWCSGVSKIAEKNLVTFKSAEEAVSAGYSPASNCPGI